MINEAISFYSKNPPNRYEMGEYTIKYKEENRNCADRIEVFLKIKDNKIEKWSFEGYTSIITTATASLFGESIIGMDLDNILKKNYKYIVELFGEEFTPRRQKAAVFGLVATQNAIHKFLNDGKKTEILDVL